MKHLVLYATLCVILMAFSCTQTNKSTTNTSKENAKNAQSTTQSDFPEVTADNQKPATSNTTDSKTKPSAQSPKPAHDPNAQSPKTTANDPSAYDMKEKQTSSGTPNTKKESVVSNGNGPKLFAFNERFGLRLEESAMNKESETSLEVLAIRDSRCPVGVNCIRAGEVEVDLKINDKETVTLTYPTAEKPGSKDNYAADQYTVRLLGASRKGNLSKPNGNKLNTLGGIEVYLKVDKK